MQRGVRMRVRGAMSGTPLKYCSMCKETKPRAEFSIRPERINGVRSYCKPCSSNRVIKWKADRPEAYANLKRNRIKIDRAVKVAELGEPCRCEICGHKFDGTGRWGPQYDHHHGTGKARGWLCNGCNRSLGWLGDNPAIVKAAYEYLLKHGFDIKRPRIA